MPLMSNLNPVISVMNCDNNVIGFDQFRNISPCPWKVLFSINFSEFWRWWPIFIFLFAYFPQFSFFWWSPMKNQWRMPTMLSSPTWTIPSQYAYRTLTDPHNLPHQKLPLYLNGPPSSHSWQSCPFPWPERSSLFRGIIHDRNSPYNSVVVDSTTFSIFRSICNQVEPFFNLFFHQS